MSKEEPAWRRKVFRELYGRVTHPEIIPLLVNLVEPHILAAEQRGFQAGVNKTGDSVGKLREQLKTMEARLDAVRKIHANDEWHCGTCADEFSSAAPWPCPTAAALAPDKP